MTHNISHSVLHRPFPLSPFLSPHPGFIRQVQSTEIKNNNEIAIVIAIVNKILTNNFSTLKYHSPSEEIKSYQEPCDNLINKSLYFTCD